MAHTSIGSSAGFSVASSLSRLAGGALLLVLLAGCAARQQDKGGAVFCSSYESNYLAQCRQNCEAETTDGDVDSLKECGDYCSAQLAKDDTFSDECSK